MAKKDVFDDFLKYSSNTLAENTNSNDDSMFQNDFFEVIKILHEFKSPNGNYSKRVQLVSWKKKRNSSPDLDIRNFSIKDNKYLKGITLSLSDIPILIKVLQDILKIKD